MVNETKASKCSSMDVATLNSMIQVKSYYDNDAKFEPNDDHYMYYRTNIKDI